MQTSTVRCNGVRDSTEQGTIDNWAAEYARRLVEKEEAERKAAYDALEKRISTHEAETATDKKSSHVFLSDAVDSTLNAANGKTAATPYSVKLVNDGLIAERNERKAQFSDLDKRLKQEITDRKNGDTALGRRIDTETQAREAADTVLGQRIDTETQAREAADTALGQRIDAEKRERSDADTQLNGQIVQETNARENADAALGARIDSEAQAREAAGTELSERLSEVEEKAHTHENMDILGDIDAERVRKWDEGSKGEITRAEYLEHLAEAERQFDILWEALGVTVYDGGWFGMEQYDIPLEGGLFEDTVFTPFDCGGFEPYVIPSGGAGAVLDGGTY